MQKKNIYSFAGNFTLWNKFTYATVIIYLKLYLSDFLQIRRAVNLAGRFDSIRSDSCRAVFASTADIAISRQDF